MRVEGVDALRIETISQVAGSKECARSSRSEEEEGSLNAIRANDSRRQE